jgi:hypothetical protein
VTQKIQVSGKCGDAIVVIGGDTPEEFLQNCAVILGDGNEIQNLFAMALDSGALTTAQAQRNVIDSGMGNAPTPAAVPASASAPAAAPAGESKSETDKWGNTFTYGVPGSPACVHGQRVQKKGMSKQNKPYTAWVCPTQTPSAYRQGVAKDPNCPVEWAR